MRFVCAAHLYLIHQSISLVAAYVSSFRDFFFAADSRFHRYMVELIIDFAWTRREEE